MGGGGYPPPGGGGYGPPPGGYGPPPGGGPPMGGMPDGGGGYGPPPMGGMPPGGMPPQPPKSGGTNWPLIIIGIVALVFALGGGGCAVCLCMASKSSTKTAASPSPDYKPTKPSQAANDVWITSERPYVKFLAPPGWTKSLKGEWGVFKSTDGQAVFAFTTFNRPGESTSRLGAAAGVLGVGEVDWRSPTYGHVGKDRFEARMGEGTCNFGGPGGYIWYATVNAGTSDQILLIYTVSSRGTKAHKDAALTAINSLQRR